MPVLLEDGPSGLPSFPDGVTVRGIDEGIAYGTPDGRHGVITEHGAHELEAGGEHFLPLSSVVTVEKVSDDEGDDPLDDIDARLYERGDKDLRYGDYGDRNGSKSKNRK